MVATVFPRSHVCHGTEVPCKQPPDVSFMKNEECTGQGKRVLCVCVRVCAMSRVTEHGKGVQCVKDLDKERFYNFPINEISC